MTPSEQKFLFALVRDALRLSSSNKIEARHHSNKHFSTLQSLGYLERGDLTKKAFQRFFDTFESISCPAAIQKLADSFAIEIHWRRPKGVVKDRLDNAGGGSSYPNMRTVFINDGASLRTWYHEFGHILYGCIKNNPEVLSLFTSVQQEIVLAYRVVTEKQMTQVEHHLTNELVAPLPGRYVLINGRYHGLDHSGDGAEGEADELWAAFFEEYQSGEELRLEVRALIEKILVAIKSLPKPLDPCDKE